MYTPVSSVWVKYVSLCFTKQEPKSVNQPLIQYSCHEFGILDFQQLAPSIPPPPRAARWRVGGEKGRERGGGFGCLHLFGRSVAVSMVMGVKIAGMSQRYSAHRVVLIAERELENEQGTGSGRAPGAQTEPVGGINARQTQPLFLGTGCFVYPFTLNGKLYFPAALRVTPVSLD